MQALPHLLSSASQMHVCHDVHKQGNSFDSAIRTHSPVKALDKGRLALQGAKLVPLAATILIGVAIRFCFPVPEGVTVQAWTLLSIFVSTVAGQPSQIAAL